MQLGKKNNNRVAIFAFYDKDGIVDDYIFVLLQEMKKHCEKIIVVINGVLKEQYQNKLQKENYLLLLRENAGFDIAGYQAGILSLREELHQIDELILFNQTIFGPVYPFEEMFSEMDSKNIDFWGITEHPGIDVDPWGTAEENFVPPHLQSYFMGIRKAMLEDASFLHYWETLPLLTSYYEAVGKHEVQFTKTFQDKGFIGKAYIETPSLEHVTDYPLMMFPLQMARDYRCPVIKRKVFFADKKEYIFNNMGSEPRQLWQWLEMSGSYNTQLILQNLIRTEAYYNILMQLADVQIIADEKNKEAAAFENRTIIAMVYENELAGTLGLALSNQPDVMLAFENEQAKKQFYKKNSKKYVERSFSFETLISQSVSTAAEVLFLTNYEVPSVDTSFVDYSRFEEAVTALLQVDTLKGAYTGAVVPFPLLHREGLTSVADSAEEKSFLNQSRCFIVKTEIVKAYLKELSKKNETFQEEGLVLPFLLCESAGLLCDFVLTETAMKSLLFTSRYMLDGISEVWATPTKRSYPMLLFRMEAIRDFFNERRYKMTVEQAIEGDLTFKQKMWIALQLFLKPTTFEKIRKLLTGGKPKEEETHEPDAVD